MVLSSSSGIVTMHTGESESIFYIKGGKVVVQETNNDQAIEVFTSKSVFRDEGEAPPREASGMLNPFYEKECGTFIQNYADFHRRELERYVQSMCNSFTLSK